MHEFLYDHFVSRNFLYIDKELQEKIKKIKIAFFGTGLSSGIAEHCARLGIMHMHLHDGDRIDLSNLNRQAFNFDQVDSFKSEVLKKRILAINPLCQISVSPQYVTNIHEIAGQIDAHDIIINTIDCNQTYFDLIEYARQRDKLVICPFNPGFGGLILCFNKDSVGCWDIFDKEKPLNDAEITKQIFLRYPHIKTIDQANCSLDQFFINSVSASYFPQIIIGALLTSAMVLTTIVKFLKKESLQLAPDIFYLNCKN